MTSSKRRMFDDLVSMKRERARERIIKSKLTAVFICTRRTVFDAEDQRYVQYLED